MYPTDPAGRIDMQTKELNNGRVAMIAIAGMVAQELATGAKLFGIDSRALPDLPVSRALFLRSA